MGSYSGSATGFIVRISRSGAGAFDWQISRKDDSVVVHRSKRTFPTRLEAILDSARAAAALRIAIEPPEVEGDSEKGE
jgi:hypothetical protein